MTEILMRSDFAIKVSLYDIRGRAIALKKFRLSYSTPLSNPVIATFDGTTYSPNCTPTENGVIIQFNNPALNVGQLRVVREITIESSTFSDGVRDIRQEELLPIQITQSYSRNVPQNTQPTAITSSQDDLLCIENVILDSQVGPKGEQGTPGTPAMDYSAPYQLIPGEFWVDMNGNKKQVFTRTIVGETVGTGTTKIFANVYLVDTLFTFDGVRSVGNFGDLVTMPQPMVRWNDGALVFYIDSPDGTNFKYTYTVKYTAR